MIYLFEDRKGRMDGFLKKEFLSNLVNTELTINVKKDELDEFFNSLGKLHALLIHKSYNFPSRDVTIEDIKSICMARDIPIVFFSGGLSNAIIDENFVVCNSGDFYNNIKLLVNEFEKSEKINLPLLVFGRKYILNVLKQLQIVVSRMLLVKPNIEKVDLKHLKNTLEHYLSAQELSEDVTKLIDWLDNLINDGKTIEAKTILHLIQKLIIKYANN